MREKLEVLKQKAIHENWPIYNIFGLSIASDYPFGDRLPMEQGKVDIVFSCQSTPPISIDWDTVEPIYTSIYRTKDNEPAWYLYRIEEYYVARYTDFIYFYITQQTIIAQISNEDLKDAYTMEFLPTILAMWLEFQGVPCLHASAVVVNDHAVAFLADTGRGKSTLAASFLQAGFSMLTDDKLPLEERNGQFWGLSGTPFLRMSPEAFKQFGSDYHELDLAMAGYSKRVGQIGRNAFGSFCRIAKPLEAIYVLERVAKQEECAVVTPISKRDAAIDLVRFDFTTRINTALGSAVKQLNFYAQLAARIPVKRLTYPTGYDHLPEVRSAILKDLEKLG